MDKGKLLALSVVAVLFAVLAFSSPQAFLSSYNVGTLLDYAATYFIAAIGLTFVIMIGSIDLSIGGMLSLFTVVFVLTLNSLGFWAYLITIGLGFLLGMANGLIFTKLKIPSFIGTFGASGVFASLALIVSGGRPIGLHPQALSLLKPLTFELGPIKGSHLLAFLLFGIFFLIQNSTPFGKYVAAVGNSERATWLSGVRVDRTKIFCFALSGLSAALASIVLVSRMLSGDPTIGTPYQLQVIAAVVVGGTALTGGVGGIFNTLLGTLIITLVGNGLYVVGIDVYYQMIITGIITMVAVILTLDRTKIKVVK
ncbi:MAG: ribose transport system permease protein [Candidatus Atribacteria bacterium]|nr:ribose transport system permease protein [Candidatus Atribacteria bacterium]